jgi:prepilin-type N-terminal cleavage/methylation domain-containing protein
MKIKNHRQGGFTLVEIMIVVAIIALLAAIAVPNFLRARERSQATTILNDARMLDGAIDQWAIENGKAKGQAVVWSDVSPYLKPGTRLVTQGGKDVLGTLYKLNAVGTTTGQVLIDATTRGAFSTDVVPTSFWDQYDG